MNTLVTNLIFYYVTTDRYFILFFKITHTKLNKVNFLIYKFYFNNVI